MISLVIPVYNYSLRLQTSLAKLASFEKKFSHALEVVFVDDGSTDDSVAVLERARDKKILRNMVIYRLAKNHGKGEAVKIGMRAAQGDYIFFTDIDIPYDLSAMNAGIAALSGGSDVVLGSRYIAGASQSVSRSSKRALSSRIFSLLANRILLSPVRDTQCGFKGFTHDAAEILTRELTVSGFAFDVELIYLAQRNAFTITTVPVTLVEESYSSVSVFRDGLRMFRDLFAIDSKYNRDRTDRHIIVTDAWYSLMFGVAVVLLSIPTLQNLGVFALLAKLGHLTFILAILAWIVVIPVGFAVWLYMLDVIRFGSRDFRYQLGRYGIVGIFNTFLNAFIFNLLIWLTNIPKGPWLIVFAIISFIIVVSQGFYWSKYWTFKSTTPYTHSEYIKFFTVSGIVSVVNISIIHIMVNVIGAPHGIDLKIWDNIALIVTVVVAVLGNFFGYRLFVFAKNES